jgi:hypothetical protein
VLLLFYVKYPRPAGRYSEALTGGGIKKIEINLEV